MHKICVMKMKKIMKPMSPAIYFIEEKQLMLLFGYCRHSGCVAEITNPFIKACGFVINITIKFCFGHMFKYSMH